MSESIMVVGAGTMGAGIAYVAAKGGYGVELVEPDAQQRERGLESIRKDAQRGGDPSVASRITMLEAIPQSSAAIVAIEAVSERLDVKRAVFAALAAALPPDALLATNTSSLSVSDVAAAVPNPQRVLGLHFFNPPAAMKLVEVVAADDTADAVIEAAFDFVETIGKTAVLTADTPGFIVNRVARPYYLQAMRALDAGVASAPELDALARAVGFRMGPFELMDLIGLDVNLATSESVYERTREERLAPLDVQRAMVEQGRLGRKTGSGFYDYAGGAPERIDLSVADADDEKNDVETVAILGFGPLADELVDLARRHYAHVQHVENEDLYDNVSLDATIVIDVGDGKSDRGDTILGLGALLPEDTILFADAYATDLGECAKRLAHPERLVGYGVLGSLEAQSALEIVDAEQTSDEALEVAQDFFESIGKGVMLVEDVPGLFLGRVVCSIVNEAVTAVQEGVADADDVDTAMRLGTNYPIGPIEWGREIGGGRATRILQRLAAADGSEFAPNRALWVLDVEEQPQAEEENAPA